MKENTEIMAMQSQNVSPVQVQDDALLSMDYDNIVALGERADKMVTALNKIMAAALKVTTARDWVLIGGTPYLQEAGATKVARLFGISTRICDGFPQVKRGEDGYPIYKYRMIFSMGGQSIEAEGMRSAGDEFFAGKKTDKNGNPVSQKALDAIPLDDVERAAYTNCMNNGIKRLIPGLRNLDVADLEAAGINIGKAGGYTFKTGSKGGNSGKAEDSGIVCADCGTPITQKVASYSQSKYGRPLCMKCQEKAKAGAGQAQSRTQAAADDDYGPLPWENGGEG